MVEYVSPNEAVFQLAGQYCGCPAFVEGNGAPVHRHVAGFGTGWPLMKICAHLHLGGIC